MADFKGPVTYLWKRCTESGLESKWNQDTTDPNYPHGKAVCRMH